METTKTQSSTLFTYSKIDFRDKLEEVSEILKFFSLKISLTSKILSHIFSTLSRITKVREIDLNKY